MTAANAVLLRMCPPDAKWSRGLQQRCSLLAISPISAEDRRGAAAGAGGEEAGRADPAGGAEAGRAGVGAAQATAAQGAAGDLGDPAGPGQAEGQAGRDQELDGDAGEEQAAVDRAAERTPAAARSISSWTR